VYLPILLIAAKALGADVATGLVVDANGNPVTRAQVGSSFTIAQAFGQTKVQISYGDPPVLSDARGAFSIPLAPIAYTHVLVAAGKDGTLGFARRQDSVSTRIVLRAPARLQLSVTKQFGHQHPFSVDLIASGSTVGYAKVASAQEQLLVPQGAMELRVGDVEAITASAEVLLSADQPSSVHMVLKPTVWAQSLGKAAPALSPTDSRNWSADSSLEALRGKWVLVSFWATWCLPCVQEMPVLIDFYEKHGAARGRFEIIAVHSPDGTSFQAIHEAYERLAKLWGRPVPFPLLFDATGDTHKRWGIQAYPTTILIDPQGRIAGAATLKDLATKLGIRQVIS
jgi:thiol-disulfide isomerase/thioredoxin